MTKFNHAFTFGFSLETYEPKGNPTAHELRAAIIGTLARYSDIELMENCGAPFDTYKVEEPHAPECPATDGMGCRCDGEKMV